MLPRTQDRIFLLGVLSVVLAVLAFYAGLARQSPVYGDFTRDYTQRLATGHADLSLQPDPRLLALADPYDPQANAGISALDTSLYRGHYYVYFGITPFITLLVPWLLVTGRHLSEPLAVALYAGGGFLLATGLILGARRRYFPAGGRGAALAAILLLGLAGPVELVARRPMIYELVIIGAWFFLALALACVFRALHAERRRGLWLGLAASALGLAVGSRASYALAAPFFLGWAWLFTTRRFGHVFTLRQWLRGALAPLAAVGAGLAAFNWVRFGNPLQFGFSYQINELDRTKVVVWAWRDFAFNFEQYFLRPWRLGTYFPFFLGERAGPISTLRDYGRTEFLYGCLATVPLLGLLAAAPWALRRTGKLGMVALLTAAIAALNLVALLGLINGSYRYQVDFVPELLLVLGWTLLALFGSKLLAGRGRIWAQAAAALLVAFSCLVTFFAQCALLDVFATYHPAAFARLARVGNAPVFWAQDLMHHQPTIPVVTVRLPTDQYGKVEPLLVTGEYTMQDFLYLYYAGPGILQVGFESMGHGGPLSAPIALDYGRPHQLEIFYGSFVPPAGHPLLETLAAGEETLLRQTLVVKLDGRTVLDGWGEFHPTKDLFYWGRSPDDAAFGARFTGRILSRSSAPLLTEPSPERNDRLAYGTVEMAVDPSALPIGVRAPLVSAGYTSAGAEVYLERIDRDSFRIGFLASGHPPQVGSRLLLAPGRPHAAAISFGSLLPPAGSPLWPDRFSADQRRQLKGQVLVRIDDRPALRLAQETAEAAPSTVQLGRNGAGFSGVAPAFGEGLTLPRRESVGETADELSRAARP